jgi:hypothetical protein
MVKVLAFFGTISVQPRWVHFKVLPGFILDR